MKILITGGAGFIGSHIAERMLKKGYKVVVLDNLSKKSKWQMPSIVDFTKGDIRDLKIVKKATEGVDYIFHQAALVSGIESFEKPKETMEVNVAGTLNVIKAAAKNKVKKILFASSCAVYGNNPVPHKENMELSPQSPYAVSKMSAENLLEMFFKKYGLKSVSLRYFNVFGPRQDDSSAYSAVIPIFIKKALNNEPLIIYGTGLQTRDFIYVEDVAKANEFMMEKEDIGIFNVGSGEEINIRELVKMIINLTNSKSKIIFKKPRKGDIKKSLADISKIKKIGFQKKFSFEKGMEVLIKNYGKKRKI